MARNAIEELRDYVRGRTELNIPMSSMTTIEVGGPADLVIHPEDRADLAKALSFLSTRQIGITLIGNGSSVLVRDNGIRGAVLCLKSGFTGISPEESLPGGPTVRVEAGAPISDLMDWCSETGFGGLEFLGGIPGTVGGAVSMNAHGWGATVAGTLVEVEAMDPMGNTHRLSGEVLKTADKNGRLASGFVIVSARFLGRERDPDDVQTMARNFINRRRSNYPVSDPVLGMVFKDVGQDPVEKMIEACGLKGVRVGDAEVSRLNANFIVNLGNAEAGNVVSLIGMIQERVYVKHKVKIESAITVTGSWLKEKVRIRE